MKLSSLLINLLLYISFSSAGQKIYSGPMLGYAAFREVKLWIQTDTQANVVISYKKENESSVNQTSVYESKKETDFIVQPVLTDLEPGKKYTYRVLINGIEVPPRFSQSFQTLPLWKHRTDAPDFTFVAGSCTYINEPAFDRPGKSYGGDYQIFSSIAKDEPDFMVWLGDNTYLREADWDSKTGIFNRYKHTRHLPELQALLSHIHHYAIWDDHDYGPNDSDYTYTKKHLTKEAFTRYWPNPDFHQDGIQGITNFFSWNDADFFLLDNRWDRSPASVSGTILGEAQLTWFLDALRYSQAKYKFVCIGGQFLNTVKLFENHSNYDDERNHIIDVIDKFKIKGVIFLTGDRHHSEISTITTKNGIDIYDITASPLTSSAHDHASELNEARVKNSHFSQRNYALLSITGKNDSRKLKVILKNSLGQSLFEYEIP